MEQTLTITPTGLSLRNNEGRNRVALIFMIAYFVFNILGMGSEFMQYQLLGREFDMDEANMNDLRQGAIGILTLLIYIGTIVTFIMWFRRSYWNLHQIVPKHVTHTEGWAAGAWFVPILNLFRPMQIMNEIYSNTHKLARPGMAVSTGLVGIWWALFIVSGIVDRISARMYWDAETLDSIREGSLAAMVSHAASIPAFIVVIILMRRVAGFEKEMWQNHHEMDISEHLIDSVPKQNHE